MRLERFEMCINVHDVGSDYDRADIADEGEDAWIFVPSGEGADYYEMDPQISSGGGHEVLPHNWAFVGLPT